MSTPSGKMYTISLSLMATHIDGPIGASIDAVEKYLRENNFSVAAYVDYAKVY
jgi:hypothetical protein